MSKVYPLLLGLVLMANPATSTAQISVRSQLSNDVVARPGESYEGSILIRNDTDEVQQAKIYQTDYLFQSDGTNYFGDPGLDDRSNANWVEISSSTMIVPPHEAVALSYRVHVPQTIASETLEGTFWSIIMVEGVPSTSPENLQNQTPDDALGVIQVTRYGVQIATHIEGTGAAELIITESAFTRTPDGEALLQISVANNGDKMVKPEVWIELYDSDGQALGRMDGLNNRIYPGTSVKQQIKLGELEPGNYRALVIMDAGDDEVFGAEFTLNID